MKEILSNVIDSLPPLPETVTKLQSYMAAAGGEVKMQKVVDILSKDPLITAELLRLANSPFYGFSREITTIQQVVSLLGVTNIKNVVIASSIRNKMQVDVSPYGLDTKAFLAQCSAESNFITDWLNEEDKALAQLLVPCSMLMRLGMILIANILISSHKDTEFLTALKANNFKNISLLEDEFCGVDSLSFLAFLFDHWKFDETLIQTIAYISAPHAATDEVKRNVYALAIANQVFDPYDGGSVYRMSVVKGLFKEASDRDVHYNYENFVKRIPNSARTNLEQLTEI